jgi:hypothetical protein
MPKSGKLRKGGNMATQKAYQLFILTMEGQVRQHYEIKCSDDSDAKERAKRFYTTYPVELWDGPRRVAHIPSKISN